MDELNIYNLILRDRERRIEFIKTFVKKHNVICVKTNVVGTHKNTLYAPVVTKYFERKIDTLIKEKNIKLVDKKTNVSLDGNYILYLFNKDVRLKDEMVKLENTKLTIKTMEELMAISEKLTGNQKYKLIVKKLLDMLYTVMVK